MRSRRVRRLVLELSVSSDIGSEFDVAAAGTAALRNCLLTSAATVATQATVWLSHEVANSSKNVGERGEAGERGERNALFSDKMRRF